MGLLASDLLARTAPASLFRDMAAARDHHTLKRQLKDQYLSSPNNQQRSTGGESPIHMPTFALTWRVAEFKEVGHWAEFFKWISIDDGFSSKNGRMSLCDYVHDLVKVE